MPHIRQEQNLWCWAVCAQMIVKFYNPNNSETQSAMVKYAHNNTLNKVGSTDDIIKIITKYGEKTLTKVTRSNFGGETSLRQKLDSGKPVIYLTNRVNSGGETKGHFRVIYGYYKQSDNKYVYLIYDPWDTVKYKNNVHFDYWRRSWQNILDEEAIGISGIDKLPKSGFTNYSGDWFIY